MYTVTALKYASTLLRTIKLYLNVAKHNKDDVNFSREQDYDIARYFYFKIDRLLLPLVIIIGYIVLVSLYLFHDLYNCLPGTHPHM